MSDASGILGQAWRALGGDAARLDRVRGIGLPPLPGVLPVARLVHDAIAAAALAAAELAGDDGTIAINPARAPPPTPRATPCSPVCACSTSPG